MADFAAWKKQATRDEMSVSICLDRSLYRRFLDASEQLQQAHESGMLEQPDAVEELAARVVELKAAIDADAAEHTFLFATMPYGAWAELAEAHPPTAQQKADNPYLDFNLDTFPPAAVAASCLEPELTGEDAEWLREQLPRAEFDRLFNAAMTVNVGGSSIPKAVSATVDRLASELKSITQPSEASPSPSSEDE